MFVLLYVSVGDTDTGCSAIFVSSQFSPYKPSIYYSLSTNVYTLISSCVKHIYIFM